MPEPMPEKIHCDHCETYLCDRRGNAIVYANLELELKRTYYIKCLECEGYTKFAVDRNERKSVPSI